MWRGHADRVRSALQRHSQKSSRVRATQSHLNASVNGPWAIHYRISSSDWFSRVRLPHVISSLKVSGESSVAERQSRNLSNCLYRARLSAVQAAYLHL